MTLITLQSAPHVKSYERLFTPRLQFVDCNPCYCWILEVLSGKIDHQGVINVYGKGVDVIIEMSDPISLEEYRKIVDYATTNGLKIPKILVQDFTDWQCRSALGRYLARIEREYRYAAIILKTVVDRPMDCEENAWCQLDFAVCSYNIDGNVEMALKRVQEVKQWVVQHEAELEFLSVEELYQVVRTLKNIYKHENRKGLKKSD